jgi:hypothetical protein
VNKKIMRILEQEFPNNPDLKDIVASVSPYMSAKSRAIQVRYFQLVKQYKDEQ